LFVVFITISIFIQKSVATTDAELLLRIMLIRIVIFSLLISPAVKNYAKNFPPELFNSKKYLPAIEINSNLSIDGELNEVEWQRADFSSSFQQNEPGDGDYPTEQTEIGCLYDKKNLYFGIRCYDSEPDKTIRTELRRDAFMDNDDYFEIILDTFNDNRSGFYFVLNPYGNKRDAKLSDEGRSYNPDWDGIWECKTEINEQGWFVEIAIPWKTLRFVEGEKIYFGANFGRMIRRKNEKLDWSHIARDVGRSGIFRLSQAGVMGPFNGLRMGGNFELQPFIIGGMQKDIQTEFHLDKIGDLGIDAKINLTSNLVADLTLNTDFAQVEADQEQVNLTRFSLYFPEKREFFLEGAEIFSASGSNRMFQGDAPIIFYSRKIGIEEGNQIPLWGGAKITGKIGKTTIGLLNMQTRATTIISDEKEEEAPTANFGVFRLKQDIFSRSSIGLILTNKVVEQNVRNNQSFAVDSRLSFTQTLTLTTLFAGTHTSDESNSKNKVANLDLNWRTDRYYVRLGFTDVEPNFNAEMGFVRRTDIRRSSGSFYFTPRAEKFISVRKFAYGFRSSYLTDHTNYLYERNINLIYIISFQSGARFNIRMGQGYEYLPDDWEVRPGIIIEDGIYEGYSIFTRYSSDEARQLAAEINLSASDYYGGKRYSLGGGINWNGIERFKVNCDYRINKIKLPFDQFNTFTLSNRLIYAFSTDAYLKAYIQYNSDRLRFDGRVKWNINILFRYIYKPGSDIYLVYNQEQLVGENNNELSNRTLMAKVVYFWRK